MDETLNRPSQAILKTRRAGTLEFEGCPNFSKQRGARPAQSLIGIAITLPSNWSLYDSKITIAATPARWNPIAANFGSILYFASLKRQFEKWTSEWLRKLGQFRSNRRRSYPTGVRIFDCCTKYNWFARFARREKLATAL